MERVLVVDDDSALRRLIAAVLGRAGCEVIEAANGAEALDIVADTLLEPSRPRPDIVISDVHMPYLSGLQLLTALRALEIPTILITAFGDDRTRELAAKLGAVATIDKPFDLDALCAMVTAPLPPRNAPP